MGELQIIQQKKKEIMAVALAHGLVNVRVFDSVARGEYGRFCRGLIA